ncbi:cytoplasmic dynein 2 light intermediate chain 1-like isoform X2 [Gigantopelta aegis]|uniref:cytoplasmic dynein 2 light intermediate chain 1-like isoform X2 n=1 Tax=Gigantopelta aegis TaxID=1735272 RepID=UPI001B887CF3|nr:cytoplasmic dynein 2 light intermediate chain 1-like isoform X2 [Gigantopelta aegis]
MSKGDNIDSLWDIAIEQDRTSKQEKGDSQTCNEDSAVFIVGSKNSGKTSMILRFLDRDEAPKPTVALEYTFGRRAKGHNIAKDVGHIWELGGGTWLAKLMDIPINPDTIMHTTLIIVLDLSLPNELWFTLESLLTAAKSRIETVIAEMKNTMPNMRDKLREKAWERVGSDHPDKNMIDPFLIPLVIVGSKFDIFQDFDPEKRKVICKTLRFYAHVHGASIQFFSTKIDQLVKKTQVAISHHLFGTNTSKTLHVEPNKPLIVPFGLDSIQQIGNPPIADQDIGRVHAKTPLELWKIAYTGYFPQEKTNNPAMVEDPAKDPQFAEPAIDALRAQKDDELERYRRLSERRAKEAGQMI